MKYVSEYEELAKYKYDTIEELEAAEKAINEQREEKRKANDLRKSDAEAVKEVIIDRINSEKECSDKKASAYKAYLSLCDEADKLIAEKKKLEVQALEDFCKKYPSGFHETIKLDDLYYRYNYISKETNNNNSTGSNFLDPFIRLYSHLNAFDAFDF